MDHFKSVPWSVDFERFYCTNMLFSYVRLHSLLLKEAVRLSIINDDETPADCEVISENEPQFVSRTSAFITTLYKPTHENCTVESGAQLLSTL